MTIKFPAVTAFSKLAIVVVLFAGGGAQASPLYSVLLESNADRASNEIYLANYASYANLLSNTLDGSSAYSTLNVSSVFSVGGYTKNHLGGYSVLLESNDDRTSNEIYIANYADYDDLLSNTLDGSSAYSTLNVSSAFSVGGFTFDGKSYSLLLESNADRTSNEIYIANYASYADLLSNTLDSSSAYSALNVSSSFSVGGFTFDGSGYSLLLESNADRINNEIYLANYASYADLLSNTLSSSSAYSTLNVSSAFSVGGLAAEFDLKPGDEIDPNSGGFPDNDPGDGGDQNGGPDNNPGDGGGQGGIPIPEPSTLGLIGIAYASFCLVAYRRRRYTGNRGLR